MAFSVLISVYFQEKPEYLARALRSITQEQTLFPGEIVLVKDGPLTDELEKVISDYTRRYPSLFRIVALPVNQGLGAALNTGIAHCKHDLVVRMDSDDISLPRRFEKQVPFLAGSGFDVVGALAVEFIGEEKNIRLGQRLPQYHEDICKRAKFRNPMTHPATAIRKQSVLKAGSYLPFLWFEDYHLWVRMISKGFRFHNLQIPLVKMRINHSTLIRRGGSRYIKQELLFQRFLLQTGFIDKKEWLLNITLRTLLRKVPSRARRWAYDSFLRDNLDGLLAMEEDSFSTLSADREGGSYHVPSNPE